MMHTILIAITASTSVDRLSIAFEHRNGSLKRLFRKSSLARVLWRRAIVSNLNF